MIYFIGFVLIKSGFILITQSLEILDKKFGNEDVFKILGLTLKRLARKNHGMELFPLFCRGNKQFYISLTYFVKF